MRPDFLWRMPKNCFSKLEYHSGGHLFRTGDPTSGFFFLEQGTITLIRETRAGDEVVIHRAFSGECFAEASLFSDSYHCDAVAQTDCVLLKVDRDKTLSWLEDHPHEAIQLIAYLAKQVQDYRRLLELRAIRSATERVLAAVSDGMLRGNIITFASQIGLTHEATYRALARLTRERRLTKVGRGDYRPQ